MNLIKDFYHYNNKYNLLFYKIIMNNFKKKNDRKNKTIIFKKCKI